MTAERWSPREVADAGFVASGSGTSRTFEQADWIVRHCGHPTANWPWMVLDPKGGLHTSGDACDLGRAFWHLTDALKHVVRHLSGDLAGKRWRSRL